MKLQYFTIGILAALVVVLAMGASKTKLEPESIQWEYAVFWDKDSIITWSDTNGIYSTGTNRNVRQWKTDMDAYVKGQHQQSRDFCEKLGIKDIPIVFLEQDILKYAGNQGWELINIKAENQNSQSYYFKRPKQ